LRWLQSRHGIGRASLSACSFFWRSISAYFIARAHNVKFKEALGWTLLWVTLSMLFAVALVGTRGQQESFEFLTGYIIELSLSMDNVFVIAVIFAFFRVPTQFQHRVLFWGIVGALVMRGLMIGGGAALIQRFSWVLYVLGAFLVITGIRMMFVSDEDIHPEKNPVLKLARKIFSHHARFRGAEVYITMEREIRSDAACAGVACS
jgi:tellurite resistance protein TerC